VSLKTYQLELLSGAVPLSKKNLKIWLCCRLGNDTDDLDSCIKWDFYNSLFFSFTVVTTIGRPLAILLLIGQKNLEKLNAIDL
jgi:hypothetical protein